MSADQTPNLHKGIKMEMQDDDAKRQGRGNGVPFPGHNRKARRRMAKKAKLFKDHSGEAWRVANDHMKERKDAKSNN